MTSHSPRWKRRVRRLIGSAPETAPPWDESVAIARPAVFPGSACGPPDFIGVGVQKAGTTWWHRLIELHPDVDVVVGMHKERHYFDRFGLGMSEAEISEYQALFPRRAGKLVGEWTPRYLYLPWAPAQIATAAPDAKLLVILRDPIERLRSGLAHHVQRAENVDSFRVAEAIERSLYGRQMERLYASVPRERVLVLQYEQLVQAPRPPLKRTYEFLGLDGSFDPDALHAPASPTTVRKDELSREFVGFAREQFAPDLALLERLVDDVDLALWPTWSSR